MIPTTPLIALGLAAAFVAGCAGGTGATERPDPTAGAPASVAPSPAASTAAPATGSPAVPTEAPAASPPPSPAASAPAPFRPAGGETVEAAMEGFAFRPDVIEVSNGATVRWTNRDAAPHTVTAGSPGARAGDFDSGLLDRGETFEVRFDEPGTYRFFCDRHPRMTGTVEVGP